MVISPLEIQKKEFTTSFRGYNKEEVDDFLDKVNYDYEKIYKENRDLKEEVNNLKEQINSYKDLELTLKNTLVMAEKTAEEIKSNAIRERNSIIKEAMIKAQDILNRAEQKYKISNDKIEELRRQFYLYKTRFKNFVQSQMEFLDSFEFKEFDNESEVMDPLMEVAVSKDEEVSTDDDFVVINFEKRSEDTDGVKEDIVVKENVEDTSEVDENNDEDIQPLEELKE